jgi:hypothetical protein
MNKLVFALLYLQVMLATAQTRSRPNDPRFESGKVSIDIDFATLPTTVEALINESTLIVDGRVAAILPSTRLDPKNLPMIQTDSLVAVTQVLAGTTSTAGATIAVSQFGGKIGDLEAVFPEDQLMTVGERYIFFLRLDKGPSPSVMGYSRYYPAGGWVGKAKVVNGSIISFPKNAYGQGLTAFNGSDVSAFLQVIEQKILKSRGARSK